MKVTSKHLDLALAEEVKTIHNCVVAQACMEAGIPQYVDKQLNLVLNRDMAYKLQSLFDIKEYGLVRAILPVEL